MKVAIHFFNELNSVMLSLPTYLEIEKLKKKLNNLQSEYNEALKADKPFHYTRKIFEEIKETSLQLEELESETTDKRNLSKSKNS